MMYTQGVRKILICSFGAYDHIDELFKIAGKTGHEAVCHNGDIYIKGDGSNWVRTPFHINDFTNLKE